MKKELNEIYIVKQDDTITTIAKKYNKNEISILISNSILPSMIKKGYVLYIK